MRCLAWLRGPIKTEKPAMTSMLPKLKASANFAGRRARKGRVRNATKKQAMAPRRHTMNPSNRSHLDSAKYASSSFDRSFERSGT